MAQTGKFVLRRGMSEPGFSGFQDFQDLSLGVYIPFRRKTLTFCKGTFGYQSLILVILKSCESWFRQKNGRGDPAPTREIFPFATSEILTTILVNYFPNRVPIPIINAYSLAFSSSIVRRWYCASVRRTNEAPRRN